MIGVLNQTCLRGIAYHLPDTIITSDELEAKLSPLYKRLKLPEGRLELMTGIKERRYWPAGTKSSDLATEAAIQLLTKENIERDEIDLLIHASVCRDFLEPASASVVHANLGLNDQTFAFDLSNACAGILSAMIIAAQMIEQGIIKNALIVGGENSAPLIFQTIKYLNNDETLSRKDLKKYFANLTIGSGASAVLLSNAKLYPDKMQLTSYSAMTDSKANHLCRGEGNPDSLMMETHSEEMMKAGIELAKKNWQAFKENHHAPPDWVIGHQVGIAHEKMILEALEIGHLPTHHTFPNFGNTGSVALPLTLAKFLEKNQEANYDLGPGVLLGIGSGLTSTFIGVKP